MSLPNFITICRLLLVPAVVYLIVTGQPLVAFWLFVVAGISDAVDGFIAKRFKAETELGAYLDPLADKALLVSIYVSLGIFGEMPIWLVFLVVSRDVFIIVAVMLSWMLSRPVAMAPLMISKANTAGQILLAAVVLADLGFGLHMRDLREWLVLLVAGLTVLSAAAYLVEWLRHMAKADGPATPDKQ
ncbi:CDP-alcohol phosphatidyltransferase family protein [Microbaculum sp. FT89]|uniref:CDP-alcohol phosphatidyltransferase family protein n=1 Tax=Microbaculum sp. FT89 TaxID=3447298 RepID=UPI003F52C69A